jgi:predicted kinase
VAVITLMMGAPASGKTTYIQQHRDLNDLVTSSDLVRFDREIEVAEAMHAFRLKGVNWAKEGKSFWVDATNTYNFHRAFWLRIAKTYQMPIRLVAIHTPYWLCQKRNNLREFPAEMKVVRSHAHRMPQALMDIKSEPYTSIEVVKEGWI